MIQIAVLAPAFPALGGQPNAVFLAVLGGLAAKVGGASVKKGVIRVAFWSALSMGAAAGIGAMFGTVVWQGKVPSGRTRKLDIT